MKMPKRKKNRNKKTYQSKRYVKARMAYIARWFKHSPRPIANIIVSSAG